ncbi:PTS fructose transporter subunit IIB [Erysipelothrix anatis]|uniref:PTS fructose transporter subunit IIB n=1 Tax=Erysipelothrix anatis TaxID=2683713 RepID=UPI00135CC496|nr:fructose PTS transporter subunit IIB [Erysipelothrix anatis]
MKIVGVVACTVGIAHTYMGQEAIEVEAQKRGYDYKVETQGGMGIDNELFDDEIEAADYVIMATSIGIEMPERFDQKKEDGKVFHMDPSVVIKNASAVFDDIEAKLNMNK